jgi:hypothetical protein
MYTIKPVEFVSTSPDTWMQPKDTTLPVVFYGTYPDTCI